MDCFHAVYCPARILQIPHGAPGLYLLGRVYRLLHRTADAKEFFLKALRRDPLLWSAYEELCALGERMGSTSEPVLRP